ncbi:MAG TPA: hypothetical protein IAA41_08035 [Candidatus Eubacterium faecavium]|nr:hypothetical protein [Candidatus Eubacterium faecavium]
MRETVKKKMSKKKKILIIVLCVILALMVLAVSAGLIALNWYCKTPDYTVYQTAQNVELVAHRGFRAVAPENTAPAFEEAGKAGFYGAECDIYRTADGVWVIHHDPITYRMTGGFNMIEDKTYDELMSETVDNGSNIENYDSLKMCTFKEYLEICSQYSMTPVIELKSANNTEYYSELLDILAEFPDLKPVFISFHYEDLTAMRKLTDAPCWYLVQEITDKDIEMALALGGDCGIDFNYAKEENTDEVIQKCIDAGLTVGAWTVNEPEAVDRLASLGVEYITTDSITY